MSWEGVTVLSRDWFAQRACGDQAEKQLLSSAASEESAKKSNCLGKQKPRPTGCSELGGRAGAVEWRTIADLQEPGVLSISEVNSDVLGHFQWHQ